MTNYFQGTKDTPHHISIGAVLLNDQGKVGVHYYGTSPIRNYPPNFYTLMHESIEPNETLEQALARGLREEFSVEATLDRYVGSMVVCYTIQGVKIEKTVLYFLCHLTSIKQRDLSDPEAVSEIRWVDIDELIDIMKEQGKRSAGDDESKILEDVKNFYLKA
jgi:8-oxo-dGTP pyrophosphatase MutT (NUDIX family)